MVRGLRSSSSSAATALPSAPVTVVLSGAAKAAAPSVDPKSTVAAQIGGVTPRYAMRADPAGIGRPGVGTLPGEEQEEDQWRKMIAAE